MSVYENRKCSSGYFAFIHLTINISSSNGYKDTKIPRVIPSRPDNLGREIRAKVDIMINIIMAQTAMVLCRELGYKENCIAGGVRELWFQQDSEQERGTQ